MIRDVEYTHCISADELDHPNECRGYDTNQFDGEAPTYGECGISLYYYHSQVHSGLEG